MPLPLFYTENLSPAGTVAALDEATARHINQVLRMKKGDRIFLTNGEGKRCTALIQEQYKKECRVYIEEAAEDIPVLQPRITVAISLLKNASRFEWFLEKATETGISSIIPLLCERTEGVHFRFERMRNILVSAMLQSRQYWLPELSSPVAFKEWISRADAPHRYIAHCLDIPKSGLAAAAASGGDKIVCIGPEGDFTPAEIDMALHYRFMPVSLGNTRLRTETAGIAAAVLLRIQ